MQIKIDTDVPFPAGVGPRTRQKYPFDKMKVGHSFAVLAKEASKHFRQYVYNINSKTKKKFVSRAMKEGKETVFRVWRIA